jgi:hypothetical protein
MAGLDPIIQHILELLDWRTVAPQFIDLNPRYNHHPTVECWIFPFHPSDSPLWKFQRSDSSQSLPHSLMVGPTESGWVAFVT